MARIDHVSWKAEFQKQNAIHFEINKPEHNLSCPLGASLPCRPCGGSSIRLCSHMLWDLKSICQTVPGKLFGGFKLATQPTFELKKRVSKMLASMQLLVVCTTQSVLDSVYGPHTMVRCWICRTHQTTSDISSNAIKASKTVDASTLPQRFLSAASVNAHCWTVWMVCSLACVHLPVFTCVLTW